MKGKNGSPFQLPGRSIEGNIACNDWGGVVDGVVIVTTSINYGTGQTGSIIESVVEEHILFVFKKMPTRKLAEVGHLQPTGCGLWLILKIPLRLIK